MLAGATVTLLNMGVQRLGWLQNWELGSFDSLVRLQPDAGPDRRLLIVAISEADIQALGRFPISDTAIAQTLTKLQKYQPKVIGLDLYRDLPQPPGHPELLAALKAPNVVAIAKMSDSDNPGVAAPPGMPPDRVGFNDFVLDADGVVRRNLLSVSQADKTIASSFSLQLALLYLKDRVQPTDSPVNPYQINWGKAEFVPLNSHSGGYANLDTRGYQILLKYRSGKQVARQVSIRQVLNGEIDPSWVKDKIVLIGTTAPSTRDVFLTPYSPIQKQNPKMPGVLLHAQMLSQILSAVSQGRSLFWVWPQWAEILWNASWALIGGVVAWRIVHPARAGFVGGVALMGLLGISLGIFIEGGWVPLVSPALGLVVTGVGVSAYRKLYDAFHDSLTGLPNRDFFVECLGRAIAHTRAHRNYLFAVLFLDLDRFKAINDSLGHLVGDELLKAVVMRLRASIAGADTVARVGGDDFAILVRNVDVDSAVNLADRIHKALIVPFDLRGQEVFVTASIGIAVGGEPTAATREQPEHLLRDAHTAMYRAKALGTGRYQVFNASMHDLALERLRLETDLRMAVKRREFLLHYQPFVCLASGKIIGFEALVRWQHPQRGLISPVKFIPVAEQTGAIVPLGEWVLEEACRQLRLWEGMFDFDRPLIMSVNLSGKQFAQPDLVERIEAILVATGLSAESLKLEITESVVMDDVESAIEVLKQMKALKVKLGIDDFGTGYSSLSYLSRFPTDTLKVDKSFVGRMELASEGENVAIVRTIVTLAHALGMDVIAEGVETAAQLARLRAIGCEYGQGYFFAKPLPSDAATALMASEPQW
ncbi:EAL domain-containing protein [Microcoleus sp. bin38.metabat.b11b12b14.051]|uniref:EAL domain-containing protein n=1 Tax=Microcoleus sp. bin38.metabat.b11b12b14.051 TaxID=2742709 RepID=UPI0025ECE976|nr:EAL domain-containing protein [Microcoleus sp. bin38.metabat.b11b12b14.051]